MNGVVQDNAGRLHFNGADTRQANFNLDGFNISDPATGQLEARVNIDAIQSMDLENSRFSADNGRGSAGVLDLKTKMGDDRFASAEPTSCRASPPMAACTSASGPRAWNSPGR